MAELTARQKEGMGEGGYRMVSADGRRKNVWASSDYTGVLEKLLKWKAYVGWESTKCATFKIQATEAEYLRVFVGMVKGDTELKIFHSMLKYNNCMLLKISLEMLLLSWGIVQWKKGRGYSIFNRTSHE